MDHLSLICKGFFQNQDVFKGYCNSLSIENRSYSIYKFGVYIFFLRLALDFVKDGREHEENYSHQE